MKYGFQVEQVGNMEPRDRERRSGREATAPEVRKELTNEKTYDLKNRSNVTQEISEKERKKKERKKER